MGKTMLRFNLADISHVRFKCKKCEKGIIEVPIEHIGKILDGSGDCRFCHHRHVMDNNFNPLDGLKKTFMELRETFKEYMTIEIDIPVSATQT